MLRRAAPILCALAIAAGCASQPGPGAKRDLGGLVTLDYSSSDAFALAFFVTGSGFLASDFSDPPRVCSHLAPGGTPTPPPGAPRYRDAGAVLTIASATSSIAMAAVGGPAPSYIYYTASPSAQMLTLDAGYEVSVSGSSDIPAATWSGALSLRHPPGFTSSLALPALGPIRLEWTPVGADFVRIDIYDGAADIVTCFADDSGSMTVPADAAAAVPAGTSNQMEISAITTGTHLLGEDEVVFMGIASTFASYAK